MRRYDSLLCGRTLILKQMLFLAFIISNTSVPDRKLLITDPDSDPQIENWEFLILNPETKVEMFFFG